MYQVLTHTLLFLGPPLCQVCHAPHMCAHTHAHTHTHTHTHTRLDTIGGEGRGGHYIHSLTHTRGDKSHIPPLQVTPHTHNGVGIRRHIFYKHCALISVAQYRQSPTCVILLLMAAFGRHLAGNCGQLVYSCWLAMTTGTNNV